MIRLSPAQHPPHVDLIDQHGARRNLSEWRGKSVIVFCYPAAGTPGCTKQSVDFQRALPRLTAAGFAVVGISPDSPETLHQVATEQGLGYPLLSDPDRETLTAWGAFGEKKLYGKTVTGVIRSTFVLGPDGALSLAKYNVRATGHVSSLMKTLGLGALD
ncbi:MAG: peroxiredoxin [Angustibacter sp.]